MSVFSAFDYLKSTNTQHTPVSKLVFIPHKEPAHKSQALSLKQINLSRWFGIAMTTLKTSGL